MRLEHTLVLTRFLHDLFGAKDFDALQADLRGKQEGPRGDGTSYFLGTLLGRTGLKLDHDLLKAYDRRVMKYEERIRKAGRPEVRWRYFQYLALLYAEVYLDRLTTDPDALLSDLNAFLSQLRLEEPALADFPAFEPDDLRRLAYFSATGSGKTLLMHANLWQVWHYLDEGSHPEGLVDTISRRPAFDHVLLITPNEGLSAQHLTDLAKSGIAAIRLEEALRDPERHVGHVKVTEIHKLAEKVSGGGVSIEIESLGASNFVLVDEGHKGTSSEAQTWKDRQKTLSRRGLLFEYSATFAQAIAAASTGKAKALAIEYGKTILFDYSYRYFYGDGYGKDFHVANVSATDQTVVDPDTLLVAGLLTFYQQRYLYAEHQEEAANVYLIAPPLWVFIGSSVNAVYTRKKQKRSDVATVLAFFRRFLSDQAWAVDEIAALLEGTSDVLAGFDTTLLGHLKGSEPAGLYQLIARDVFGGTGALDVWELKKGEGEFGLRVSTASTARESQGEESAPYFGVVSIGDASAFKKHLREYAEIDVLEDALSEPLFAQINEAGSNVQVLIGAKKFVEGWSSWRVSTMGLLNVGKGEGSQVIQLFGRGVRLRGRGFSLKRSYGEPDAPSWLRPLETLGIVGWNADYVSAFRAMLETEGVTHTATVETELMDPIPDGLLIPQPEPGFDASKFSFVLESTDAVSQVTVDRRPKITYAGAIGGSFDSTTTDANNTLVPFETSPYADVLDFPALHRDILAHLELKSIGHLHVPASVLPEVLRDRCRVLMPKQAWTDPERLQDGARDALRLYAEKFLAHKEREAESDALTVQAFDPGSKLGQALVVRSYVIQADEQALLDSVLALAASGDLWKHDPTDANFPRIRFDRHIYNPLPLIHADLKVTPGPLNEGEARIVDDLREFVEDHRGEEGFDYLENLVLLRNIPRVGVGFYERSGFYPDFVLWIRRGDSTQRVVFLEPHGMRNETDGVDAPKLRALLDLRALSDMQPFQDAKLELDGFILTTTPQSDIRGAAEADKDALAQNQALVLLDPDAARKIQREWWVPYALGIST